MHPEDFMPQLLHWLDGIILDYGLYIYIGMVWLSPFLIVWILRGGFWRRPPRPRRGRVPPIIRQEEAARPAAPTLTPKDEACSDEEISFAD